MIRNFLIKSLTNYKKMEKISIILGILGSPDHIAAKILLSKNLNNYC